MARSATTIDGMNEFFVDPDGLRRHAAVVGQEAEEARIAHDYAGHWLGSQLAGGGGVMFTDSVQALQRVGDALGQLLERTRQTLLGSERELQQTATWYVAQEREAAAHADRMLPSASYDHDSGGGL